MMERIFISHSALAEHFIIQKDASPSRQRYFTGYMLLSVQVHISILRRHLFCCLLPCRRGLPIACDDGHLFRRNKKTSEQSGLCSDVLLRNSIDALTFRSASKAKPGAAVVIRKGGATERARDGVCFEKENAVANDRQSATTWCEYS